MRIGHLRSKLVLAGIAITVPFVVSHALFLTYRFKENRAKALAAQQEVARDVADACTAYVYNLIGFNRTLGLTLWGKHRMPRSDAREFLRNAARASPTVKHLAATDARGVVIASDVPGLIGLNVSSRPFIQQVIRGGEWSVGDVFAAKIDRQPHLYGIAVGVRDSLGKLQGMVVALSDEGCLEQALRHDIMGPQMVAITDAQGEVVLSHGGPALTAPQRRWANLPFVRCCLAGRPSIAERFEMPDGKVMMGSMVPIPAFGWTAGAFMPRDDVIGPIRRQVLLRSLLVLIVIGFTLGFTVYLGSRLARPILDLAQAARRFGRGDLDARAEVRAGDEMEFLADSFNEMAAALQRSTSEFNEVIDAERRQSSQASVLYSVAQGLVVTMDLHGRLKVIAQALASISSAKRCAILLRRGNHLVAASGWGLLDEEFFRGISIEIGEPSGMVHEALVPGEPILVPDAVNDGRLPPELLARANIKGFLALPLVRAGHIVGLAFLDTPGEEPYFDQEAIETARGLSTLAAIAIENAETFEKWLKVAKALQGAMLPTVGERYGKFSFACRYYAGLEVAELGGDFYDLIILPNGELGLVIADVSGKGLEAAVFTAMGKYTLRAFASEQPDPGPAMKRANDALAKAGSEWGFITMFYGTLDVDTGRLVYANAGHPPALVVSNDGREICLSSSEPQPPLGIFQDAAYLEESIELAPGDILVCYTDGVTDARRDGELFDLDRLADVLRRSRHLSPSDIAEAVYEAVNEFSRGRLQDDIALLVARREAT
jgi:serine phosphatase RsbU (regulator of sigma subunit)/HAMP domain-containing protein